MTDESELLSQIQTTLGQAMRPSLTKDSNVSDLFEAFVFSLVIEAAKAEGATIEYWDAHENLANRFVFRTSPGHIFSTIHPYTHATIGFPGKPLLEAHLGVRVSGRSKVLHEADVVVIRHDEAVTCRRNRVPPR